jgi:hypothetical protein
VGLRSVLWAFVFGPFFYWKKGARLEAAVMLLSAAPLLAVDQNSVSLVAIPYLSATLWTVIAALAPVLLVMHYRRKGWLELP